MIGMCRVNGIQRAGWIGGALLLGVLWGCEQQPTSTPPAAPTEIGGSGMNVILLSIDTLRADHLGCYGHPEVKTPVIDKLAAEGTRFAECLSSCPITLPSHTTMLTGSYQYIHGARDNGSFMVGDENVTIAEILREEGYQTVAEVAAAVLNKQYGLNQGFDHYGDISNKVRDLRVRVKPTTQPSEAEDGDRATPRAWEAFDRKADAVSDAAIAQIERVASDGRPFFFFLHYFEPHQPYTAPPPFSESYVDGYLAEIAYVDEQIGRVIEALHEHDLVGKTLLLLVADHGEGLGQHGEETHSYFVYDATLHVPCIAWCPGHVPAGQVVQSQVRLVDLAPTILDFLKLDRRTPQMQGCSLLSLIADPELDLELAAYGDTMSAQLLFGYSMLRCIRDGGWKYILSPEPELYHVSQDSLEVMNLAVGEPERASEMRQQLWDLIVNSPPPPGGRGTRKTLDSEEIQKLQALGYVGADESAADEAMVGSELDNFEPTGIAPRRRLEVIQLANLSVGTLLSGDYETAVRMYERMLTLEPGNPKLHKDMADALVALERRTEAIEHYRRALEKKPTLTPAWIGLGTLLAEEGQLSEAEEALRNAIEIGFDDFAARFHLANVLRLQGRIDEALPEYEAAVALEPGSVPLRTQWGRALMQAGQFAKAEKQLQGVVDEPGGLQLASVSLAQLYLRTGRADEAVALLERALEEDGQNVAVLELLASECTRREQFERAEQYYERAAAVEENSPRAILARGRREALRGNFTAAIAAYKDVLDQEPNHPGALVDLCAAFEHTGRLEQAAAAYERLLKLRPRDPQLYKNAASVFERLGRRPQVISVLNDAHNLFPGDPEVANNLAWCLATSRQPALRDGARAIELAQAAQVTLGGDAPGMLDTLAAALAEAGRFPEAVQTAQRAIELAKAQSRVDLAAGLTQRLKLYQTGQPYHEGG